MKDENDFIKEMQRISKELMQLSNHHSIARGHLVDAVLKADAELHKVISVK